LSCAEEQWFAEFCDVVTDETLDAALQVGVAVGTEVLDLQHKWAPDAPPLKKSFPVTASSVGDKNTTLGVVTVLIT
jgi:hypothetical protein